MKTSENKKAMVFKGAGYLIGSAITLLLGIGLFVLYENIVISISSSIPIGITVGIVLEEKFQDAWKAADAKPKRILFGLVLLGIIAFITVLFLIK